MQWLIACFDVSARSAQLATTTPLATRCLTGCRRLPNRAREAPEATVHPVPATVLRAHLSGEYSRIKVQAQSLIDVLSEQLAGLWNIASISRFRFLDALGGHVPRIFAAIALVRSVTSEP